MKEHNIKRNSTVDLEDVGLWPIKIRDHTRILLVRQGAPAVQHLDSDFCEAICVGALIKGGNRKHTSNWFQQLHVLAKKYSFLTPTNLLSDKYECKLSHDHEGISQEEFLVGRKKDFKISLLLLLRKMKHKPGRKAPLNFCSL